MEHTSVIGDLGVMPRFRNRPAGETRAQLISIGVEIARNFLSEQPGEIDAAVYEAANSIISFDSSRRVEDEIYHEIKAAIQPPID